MRFKNYVLEQASQGTHWKDQRYEYYESGDLKYRGASTEHKTDTDTGNEWHIWRYTWDANGNVIRIEGPLQGNWENREYLAWSFWDD